MSGHGEAHREQKERGKGGRDKGAARGRTGGMGGAVGGGARSVLLLCACGCPRAVRDRKAGRRREEREKKRRREGKNKRENGKKSYLEISEKNKI
jgi:hypothetical protein